MELGSETDIGFVEGNKEEGEDLANFDEEDLRLLIIFVAVNIQYDRWRKNLVPSVYHPDNPSRINFSNQWECVVLEARNSAEGVDKARVCKEVGVEGNLLFSR